MNPWDAFTWLCSAALTVAAVAIFVLFLRDLGEFINRGGPEQK
jgi:hypothetical protein